MLRSTYLANVKKLTPEEQKQVINIAAWFHSDKMNEDKRLAPSEDLLNDFKKWRINWEQYEVRFKEEMKQEPMLTALRQLYVACKDQDVILVCYCGDYKQCHRRLIGEFIQSYGIMYNEIGVAESDIPYKCIVSKDTWYCNKCGKKHDRLYINVYDSNHYCPDCVPQDVKDQSVDVNQNQIVIEKEEVL